MPKRYLAPWQQEDLWEVFRERGEIPAALRGLPGKPAIYHCVSRVVDRRFVLQAREREQFVSYMRIYEAFCQVRVLAFCVMSNHFHILLEVPAAPENRGRSWSDAKLLKHLRLLHSSDQLREITAQLALFREQNNHRAAEALRARVFKRMWDLSEFMRSLKQRFSRWFNKAHDRTGTLWEDRFRSTLVESGRAARIVAAYIDLNPVRAGIVQQPEDYRWCSLGEAVAGIVRAREGLQRVMYERVRDAGPEGQGVEELLNWRRTVARYRQLLRVDLARAAENPESVSLATLREGDYLRYRIQHFTSGLALGGKEFLDGIFAATRGFFGPKRRRGARPLTLGAGDLCSLRDPQ